MALLVNFFLLPACQPKVARPFAFRKTPSKNRLSGGLPTTFGASAWQSHNFAPPPHSGFALSIQELCFPYLSLVYMAYAYIKSYLEKVT